MFSLTIQIKPLYNEIEGTDQSLSLNFFQVVRKTQYLSSTMSDMHYVILRNFFNGISLERKVKTVKWL